MTEAIIMPCAGFGSRLGLPYPKELHAVGPATSLIDLSLSKMLPMFPSGSKIICVAPKFKIEIYAYLCRKYGDRYLVEFVESQYQDPEYTGSLLRASSIIQKGALVLLPDTMFSPRFDPKAFWETVNKNRAAGVPTLLVQKASGPILSSKGALKISNDRVLHYEDKPTCYKSYNAFWGGMFLPPYGKGLDLFHACANRFDVNVDRLNQYLSGEILYIDKYQDLGTWDQLLNFRSNSERNSSKNQNMND